MITEKVDVSEVGTGSRFSLSFGEYPPTVDLLTRGQVVPLEGTQGVYRPKISSSLRTYGEKQECAAWVSSVSVRCSRVRLSVCAARCSVSLLSSVIVWFVCL